MHRTLAALAGVGLGMGLMYLLDPQTGRRRRALIRDKAVHLAHEAQDAAETVVRDAKNRAQGLAHGDLTGLAFGRGWDGRLLGGWSPTARALMTCAGAGLFVYGLTREAPTACLLGVAGLALAAEGITNADTEDLAAIPSAVTGAARDAAGAATEFVGTGGRSGEAERRRGAAQAAGV